MICCLARLEAADPGEKRHVIFYGHKILCHFLIAFSALTRKRHVVFCINIQGRLWKTTCRFRASKFKNKNEIFSSNQKWVILLF